MEELQARGWDCVDVVLVTGAAHVDHPSFPSAILGRALEAAGFRVGILPLPDAGDPESVAALGQPRLFFGVTAGPLDSMVANYTALGRRRSDDSYSPGGRAGARPDRAVTVYCNLIRRRFGKATPIVAGGIEASLRRFSHYDFWSDSVRRSLLLDCGADLLVHGGGEGPIVELARLFDSLGDLAESARGDRYESGLRLIPGVMWKEPASRPAPESGVELPAHEEAKGAGAAFARAHATLERNLGQRMWQQSGGMRVVANAPWAPTADEMDAIYAQPFTRNPHPCYGGVKIPGAEQVRFSVTTHRGCAGGCAFCAISAHQGKGVLSRSADSVLEEVERISRHPDFRGTVPDVGGPTANMYGAKCTRKEPCNRVSCLWPERCPDFADDQKAYLALLSRAARAEGLRNLFVTTGVRMDLALGSPEFVDALALRYTSGHLKIAPEHIAPAVLNAMRKPSGRDFARFVAEHKKLSLKAGKNQFVVPYLMAAHPGCTMDDMVDLALFLSKEGIRAEQCQVFTPTPGTASSVMYATGLDPMTMKPVFVEKDPQRKRLQKALILYHLPENRRLVREALKACGRERELPKFSRRR